MKRNKLIVAAIVLLSLLAVVTAAFRLCRYYLPQDGSTCALYERYKDNPHVKASYLRDFRVNDTLAVDALLLQATSDSAFCALLRDFGVPEEIIDDYKYDNESLVGNHKHSILYFYKDKNNPQKTLPRENPDSRLVLGSFKNKSLCVFMTADTHFKEIIFYNELSNIRSR